MAVQPAASCSPEDLREEGNAFFRSKDYIHALNCYQQALSTLNDADGSNTTLRETLSSNMAACLLQLKRYQEVIDVTSNILSNSVNVKALFRRAQAKKHLDDLTGALADLKLGLDAAPSNRDLQQELVEVQQLVADAVVLSPASFISECTEAAALSSALLRNASRLVADATCQGVFLQLLKKLVTDCDNSTAEAIRVQATAHVIAVLDEHRLSPVVSEAALLFVAHLVQALEASTIEEEVLRSVVGNMSGLVSHAAVQKAGIKMFASIDAENPKMQKLLELAVAPLVVAMGAHQNDLDVQQAACKAITNLAYSEHLQAQLIELGAPKLVVAALRTHGAVAEMAQNACGALTNLSYDNESVQALIVDEGGVPLICTAVRTHPQNGDLAFMAFTAMCDLAGKPALQTQVARECKVELILESMRQHPQHPGVLQYGMGMLAILCSRDGLYSLTCVMLTVMSV
eukprot:TRINITY_DN2067_c0_g1_i1.p2 TRINITY_DN2067_c0_g1~~TRINITY_DN2067_c0_g1_i1.p2  ORF type:complete len:459 (-),score=111.89 TRINITY_DN2067_c0_g1_i1:2109-3485(-)